MYSTNKTTVYYLIVSEKTNKPLLQDCKLPMYWSKKVADERVKLFPGFKVIKIDAKKFNNLIK